MAGKSVFHRFFKVSLTAASLHAIAFLSLNALMNAVSMAGGPESAMIALPEGCGISVRWVCPPIDVSSIQRDDSASTDGPVFSVDSAGNPWISPDRKRILCPARGFAATLTEPFRDMVHLDSGPLFVSDSRMLGILAPPPKDEKGPEGLPRALFQPLSALPGLSARMYGGAGDRLYFSAREPGSSKTSVYLLETGQEMRYLKVFEADDPATAVAGSGARTFVALGSLLVCVTSASGKSDGPGSVQAMPWSAQPSEEVLDMAFDTHTGLFVATAGGVGYVGQKRVTMFLSAPSPRIFLKKRTLFVFFPGNLGVAAIENAGGLKILDIAE